jgi:PPP family 3-phenylpropionic acid transporter
MSLIQKTRRYLPELRAASFHFSVFLSSGVGAVYFAIWLSDKGISADEIGIINAVPSLIMLAVNLFVGRIADKASDWRQVILIMALVAGVAPIGLFFVDEFWGVLLVWTVIVLPAGSIPPVIDAATIRMTQRNGTDFGFVRAWGTVGYMLATASAGVIIATFGGAAFVPLFVAFSLLRAALALQLPRFRAPEHQQTLASVNPLAGRLRDVLKPWFVLPLVAYALINVTHFVLTAFAALVWKEQGISENLIGPLLAVSALAEAMMMFAWKRFGGRISARQMILIAAIFTIVRWTGMAFNPPVAVLFVLQTMHAITYAVGYFGMVHFIANWTSEEIAAEAQGFAFVLQQSGAVVGLLIFGWLIGISGARGFLFASVLGAAAVVCVLVSLRLKPPHEMQIGKAAGL